MISPDARSLSWSVGLSTPLPFFFVDFADARRACRSETTILTLPTNYKKVNARYGFTTSLENFDKMNGGGQRKTPNIERQIEALQQRVRELEVENRRLSVRNSLEKDTIRQRNAERALEESRTRIRFLEGEVSELERERASLQYEVKMLRGVVDLESTPDCVLTAADALAQVAELEEAQRKSNAKLASEREALQMCLVRLSEAEQELFSMSEEAEASRAATESMRKESETLSEEVRGLRVSCARLTDANAKSAEKLDKLIAAVERANAETVIARESLEKRNIEFERVQNELDEVQRSWDAGHSAFSQSQLLLEKANKKAASLSGVAEELQRIAADIDSSPYRTLNNLSVK